MRFQAVEQAGLHFAAVDAASPGDQLERVLGSGWQALSFRGLSARVRELEAAGEFPAARFTRTLSNYMLSVGLLTAGEAPTMLSARHSSGIAHGPTKAYRAKYD